MSGTEEPITGQDHTTDEKFGSLEDKPIPGLPNGPCTVCGSDTHSTEGHGKRGGARAGGGRREGSKNLSTLERDAIRQRMLDRIHGRTDDLVNAQLNKALGETYLMRKVTERDGKGKVKRIYHEIVDNPQTILEYLDGEVNDEPIHDDENYYYMTTRPADNLALQALLDRAFGRATNVIDDTGTKKVIIETRRFGTPAAAEATSGTNN